MWGVSAAVGVMTGGKLNDRLGSKTVIISALTLLAAS
jgi:predicted MFS family arabinose efflux permease